MLEVRLAAAADEDLAEVQRPLRGGRRRTRSSRAVSRAHGFALDGYEPNLDVLGRAHSAVHETNWNGSTSRAPPTRAPSSSTRTCPATCYGPIGGNLHAPDEWVDLESVRETTLVLALAAAEWCR